MSTRIAIALILFALCTPLTAGVIKYKSWIDSPEAYLLTAAEREEWETIGSDEAAEDFVMRYFEKRGSDFREELARRIEITDQSFTAGRVRGSRTLRGKLVIVFGVPQAIERTRRVQFGPAESRELAAAYSSVPPSNIRPKAPRTESQTEVFTWMVRGAPLRVRVDILPNGLEHLRGSRQEIATLNAQLRAMADASLAASR